MSTRDKLAEGVMDNLNPENFMDEAVKVKITLHMKPVIEALLSQGWRPPMRVIETVEELEAVQFPAILEGSGTYMDGKSTFQNCQFRPVPEWAGGEPGVFETLIVAGVGAPACAWAKDIQLPVKVLWEPEVKA